MPPMKASRLNAIPKSKSTTLSTEKGITFRAFLDGKAPQGHGFKFASLFSGAGIGDYGLTLAGATCVAACEIDPHRRLVHQENIESKLFGDLLRSSQGIVELLRNSNLDLLIATPPCQSFSTANAGRGQRHDYVHASKDARNHLFFHALSVAAKIKPRFVVFENVPNFHEKKVAHPARNNVIGRVVDFMDSAMSGYIAWHGTPCFSELGVPQRRKRALSIYVRRDVAELLQIRAQDLDPKLWPSAPRRAPKDISEALKLSTTKSWLDHRKQDHLHTWPDYSPTHLSWISSIPKNSGLSAWTNSCENCGSGFTPWGELTCTSCGKLIRSRPHVTQRDGNIRPVRGFRTSYRRMNPHELAPTITTASGHFSSDLKLHPSEDRVLSPRECAILQTIPRTFEWPSIPRQKRAYLFREMIGEAVPCLVTYRLGLAVGEWVHRLQA